MENLKIAVAQFEPKDGDKKYNLAAVEELTKRAKENGADVISFHEMSITAYTFFKNLDRSQAFEFAEEVPGGESCQRLISISEKYDIPVLAGLVELHNDKIFNAYLCVDSSGVIAKYRKLHPFINHFMSAGNQSVVLIFLDGNVEYLFVTTITSLKTFELPHYWELMSFLLLM